MSKSKLVRSGLLGSAAALALLGATTTAQAVETQFGEVSITFDTTVSIGASMKTADRITDFLNEANGGPVDARGNPALGGIPIANYNNTVGTFGGRTGSAFYHVVQNNFDGSLNADDGRLNFDNGDLIGANVKANHDLVMKWRNYTVFARAVGFYDVIMNDEGAGNRSELIDQALGDVGRNYELLDLFLSADYTIADMPVNLRVGKQVINWGESTFIQGGNNVFNPIDVGAFRRPGSEIKEALVPVNAVFGSISLPFDVSIAGYYALDWEPFEVDPSGTPFSGTDVLTLGSGRGGNENRGSFLTGSPFSGQRRNCTAAATSGTKLVQTTDWDLITPGIQSLLPDPLAATAAVGNNKLECSDSPFVNYQVPYTIGQHERVRWDLTRTLGNDGVTNRTQAILSRGDDRFASDDGQYGISMRWYAESLGGTEFGFYYQNYHSRLPFVSESFPGGIAQISYFLNGDNIAASAGGIGGRQLNPAGCGINAGNIAAIQILPGDSALTIATKRATFGAIVNGTFNAVYSGANAAQGTFLKTTPITDPGGILATAQAGLAQHGITLHNAGGTIGINNLYNLALTNCVLNYYQSGVVGAPANTIQSLNGAEFLVHAGGLNVDVEYPEDIKVLGMSFNTTLWGWGVQGDFTYRDEAPFQVDTDSLTIAALVKGCTFNVLQGVAAVSVLNPLATPDATGVKPVCGAAGDGIVHGVIRNQMYTGQIGTTSTFTASDWFIDMIGADLGVLVTEVGFALVPGVEATWINNLPAAAQTTTIQYQNTGCQGTDLPAGGFLALDAKTSKQCRPTDFSAGGVMLFRWEYNNAFDSGWVLAPQLVYAYDFMGVTPAPYGNYLEDRQSVGLSLTGTLNNNLRVGASYSNFFGGHVNNKSRDQDFTSLTASYTF